MITTSVNVVLIFGFACFFWVALLFIGIFVEAKYSLHQKSIPVIKEFIRTSGKVIMMITILAVIGTLCIISYF